MACCNNNIESGFISADSASLISTNHKVILSEICKIQSAIIDHILSGSTDDSIIVRNYTPMTNIGSIKSVKLLASGHGYENIDTPDLIEPTVAIVVSGTGAELSYTINPNYHGFEDVELVADGFGYTYNDTVVDITPVDVGIGADARIEIEVWDFGTNTNLYFQQFTGLLDNRVIQNQLTSVLSHFRNLGYAIDILVNPLTTDTIMWKISY